MSKGGPLWLERIGSASSGPGPTGTQPRHPAGTCAPSATRSLAPDRSHFAPLRSRLRAHQAHRSPAATAVRSPHPLSDHSATPSSPPAPSAANWRRAARRQLRHLRRQPQRTESGSWIAASTRRVLAQWGQSKTSTHPQCGPRIAPPATASLATATLWIDRTLWPRRKRLRSSCASTSVCPWAASRTAALDHCA